MKNTFPKSKAILSLLIVLLYISCTNEQEDLPYPDLVVQTGYSPGGDAWIIGNIGNYQNVAVTVRSFDLGIVFHSDNYLLNWHGENMSSDNNEIIPTGTYFYTIEVPEHRKLSGELFVNSL